MNQRDRLIELLKHEFGTKVSEITADWLIANGVIVLPCKVGDTVYCIKLLQDGKFTRIVSDGEKVKAISVNSHGTFLVVDYCHTLDCRDFGKTVFLSREEVEKALKEIKGDG